MQANNTNNDLFDDTFFDQAWENMNEKLDREMSKEKKRRRFLPWFFMMVGCVIGILFWKGFSSNHPISTVKTIQNPIAESNVTKSNFVEQNKNTLVLPKQKIVSKQVMKGDFKSNLKNDFKKITVNSSPIADEQKILPYEFENLESNSSQQERVINSVVTIPNASIFLLEKTKDRLILNEKYLPVAVDRPTNSNLNPPKRKIEFNLSLIHI